MDRETWDRKVLQTIEANDMLRQGERVLAGVSGGADSVALLDFLCALRGREEWRVRVCVCHVHHGLRGEEADRDASFVERLCERYGVSCRVFRLDVAAEARRTGRGLEEAGRSARYRCFEEAARAFGADRVATAHTLSDSLETALLNLARGTGLRGLCGVPPVRGKIVRPLIGVSRAEVEDYCARRGLAFVGDSTNDGDDYSRNLLRHRAVPALYAVNPAADRAYARLRETLGRTRDYLDEQARALLAAAADGDGYDAAALLRAHPAPRREALALLLRREGAQVSADGVDALEGALAAGEDACRCISGARRWRLCGGRVSFEDTAGAKEGESSGGPVPMPMEGGTVAQFDGKIVVFLCETYEHYKENENIEKRPLKNVADYDKIGNNAAIRTRLPGDRFSAPGRGWTKTLKKLLNEAGVPAGERDRLLVCADDAGVFWLEGFGVDARAAVDEATRRVLMIRAENTSGGQCRMKDNGRKMEDDILRVLITERELADKVAELGARISRDYADRNLMMVSVLKGSVVFMADLMRSITINAPIDFMAVSSYGSGVKTSGVVKIIKDLDQPLAGRDILIVEDILDSGKTLEYLIGALTTRGPSSVRIAALLDKPDRREADIRPDYVGFTVPDEFVVGYGLDYAEKYRNLPFVGVLRPEVYSAPGR